MFKSGDRVIYSGEGLFKYQLDGASGVVIECRTNETSSVNFDLHGLFTCKNINLSPAPDGPVRTVTRREIVPGVYGKVRVNECGIGGGVESIEMRPTRSPEELRESAHILNQLAEALEDKP